MAELCLYFQSELSRFFPPVHAQTLVCRGNGVVLPCPPVTCPADKMAFTGTVPAIDSTLWVLPSGSCSDSRIPNSIVLTQTVDICRFETKTCGPYTATNVDPGPSAPCLTSTLTVRVNTSMTSSLVQIGTRDVYGHIIIINTTQIMIIGKPVASIKCLFQNECIHNSISCIHM